MTSESINLFDYKNVKELRELLNEMCDEGLHSIFEVLPKKLIVSTRDDYKTNSIIGHVLKERKSPRHP